MSTRPVVLHVLHDSAPGGAGLAVLRYAAALRDVGYEPAFWLPGEGPGVAMAREITDRVIVHDRPIRYSLRGMREAPGAVRRLGATPGYVREFRRAVRALDPAVVHANTLYTLPEAFAAKRMGLPVVGHVHEILASRPKDRAILRAYARGCHHLVAVSDACAAPLRARVPAARVSVVRNGVAANGAARTTPPPGPPVIGTVGEVCRRKGTDLFLDMAERVTAVHPDASFVVMGGDGRGQDAAFADGIHRRAEALAPGLDVSIGFRPNAAAEIASWTVFALPARQDPFPLAVLEAMAAGLPVVGTTVGGIPEQIVDGVSGVLVRPDDAGAMSDAVLGLLADPARAAAIGRAGSERARSEFLLDVQARRMAAVYDRVRGA